MLEICEFRRYEKIVQKSNKKTTTFSETQIEKEKFLKLLSTFLSMF